MITIGAFEEELLDEPPCVAAIAPPAAAAAPIAAMIQIFFDPPLFEVDTPGVLVCVMIAVAVWP